MHIWKTLKLFVSSTYKDLEQERDALAGVFQHLQATIADRRLHLIPYDMRWRDADESDLVGWCLSTVRDCDYFVGILGYRYGWRPNEGEHGAPNPSRLSITEMEINEALRCIPKHQRFFCFGDLAQYSTAQLNSETQEDLASLRALRQRLKDQGETILEYRNGQDVIEWLLPQLQGQIDQDFPTEQQAELESYSRREALQEILEEKRRGFVGQQIYLQHLEEFCSSTDETNVLVLHAVAGTGKSALLASFLHTWERQHPEHPYIGHYMSMAGESSSVAGVMQSLGEQLQALGLLAEPLELAPDQLIPQVRSTLQTLTQPLVVALDGLDEMDEEGHDLSWLPQWLGPNVRVILTTRPVTVWEKLQQLPQSRVLQLPPLEPQHILAIIQQYRDKHNLSISTLDEQALLQRAAGSPLFLKVALDEMAAGGVAVGQLAETIEALFRQILERLQARYGKEVILQYLGLIAASRSGLAESELQDILTTATGEPLSDDRRLRIQRSLANFVLQREKLLQFFHPEFARTVKMMLGKAGMRSYHQQLASYYQRQGYRYERTLRNLPYQLQWGEQYNDWLYTIGNIDFLQAKSEAGMLPDLRNDLAFGLQSLVVSIPSHAKVEIAPSVAIDRKLVQLLLRCIDFAFNFLIQHPECLFQTLWNQGYWHDSPNAAPHYPDAPDSAPWHQPGPKLSGLVESWRNQASTQGRAWIQMLRPLPDRLDSSMQRMFRGHKELVTGVSMSSDQSLLASGSWDRDVRLWDVQTGQCTRVLPGHDDFISSVCFTPDNQHVLSSSGDGTVRMWNVKSGQCVSQLRGHDKLIATVACDSSGRFALTGSKDKTVRLWDLQTSQCVQAFEGHNKVINSVCFHPDNRHILSGSWDNTARLWDRETGQCVRIFEGHQDDIKSIAIDASGQRLYTASKDETARIWDLSTGQCLHVLPHQGTVFSIQASADGQKVMTGVYGTLRLWNGDTGELLSQFDGHESAIYSLYLDPQGHRAVTGSGDKTIRLWDLQNNQASLTLDGHARDIRDVVHNDDGSIIVTGSKDHTLRVWNNGPTLSWEALEGHDGAISCLHLAQDGVTLASGSADRTVRIWNLQDRVCTHILRGHSKHVTSVFVHGSHHVVSGSRGHALWLWDLRSQECTARWTGHQGDIRGLYWHPNGRWIVSGAEDRTARLWDVSTGTCVHVLQGHRDGILSVGMSDDEQWIYTSSRDNTQRIWNAQTGEPVQLLEGRGNVHQQGRDYYAMSGSVETVVYQSNDHTPLGHLPFLLRESSMSSNNHVIGYAGVNLMLAKWHPNPS
ncbi:MAG: DUF4062 domain-containing protein [Deltaproteobacteria bacterium]|nr:MAG: DUF4062 domain-containing protein [Deltaproteobacteria bacterium]